MQFYYGHITAYEERGKAHKFTLHTLHQDPQKRQKVPFTLFDREIAFEANQCCVKGVPVVVACRIKTREYEGKVYVDLFAECIAVSVKDLHQAVKPPTIAKVPNVTPIDEDDIPF